jgi:uncharacterized protein (TIGR04255 family)
MATSSLGPLPDYDLPPVIEVVCGLQFAALDGFQATAFGLLWERFRSEYPTCEQQPPLPQVIERFGEPVAEEPRVEISSGLPLPRMFFVHQRPCWLVQVQSDRFLHNWRKQQETDVYPHFPEVFNRFWAAWERFRGFCQDDKIGTPEINQLEVTYINHIVQGEGWDGTATIGQVFPDLAWRPKRTFLPSPESAAWKVSFAMPDGSGRLHASLRHAVRRSDMKPVLLCELTARGVPDKLTDDAIREWFHLGREWIVRGFADLTHEKVQKEVWKRKKV